jgi:hypothetical protein
VEIFRLATWIEDEEKELAGAVMACKAVKPLLGVAIEDFAKWRKCINMNL